MSLFIRLLLAHFIADFPLQTKEVFHIKSNTEWGVLLHTTIVLVFSTLLSFQYLENPRAIMIVLIVFITHTIIDKVKLDYLKKNNNNDIKIFMLDQFLHISIIFFLTFNFNQKYLLVSPFKNAFLDYLIEIYNNDILMIYLMGYILSVFLIPILLLYVHGDVNETQTETIIIRKKVYIKIPSNEIIDKIYRFFLTISSQLLDERNIILIFLIFLVANFFQYKLNQDKVDKVFNLKRILNTSLAIFIGILLKFI